MPFNGSGTFTPQTSPGYPAVSGTTIASEQFNRVVADFAEGLSNTLTRDGQSSPTNDLPMGGRKHTGVADATARSQYATVGQVQDSAATKLTSVNGTNTITASAPFSMTAYVTGMNFWFVAVGANTGAVTLNLNGLGAKAVTKRGTTALAANDIISGEVCSVYYDGAQFQLFRQAVPVVGVDAQAYDADLNAIAALSTTSFGRSLLTQADAPTARGTLGAQETLSSSNLKTVGGTSLLGSGDVPIGAMGQTWSNVSRASGTSFQNTTNTVQVFSMSVSGLSSLMIEVSPDNSTFYKVFQASNVFGNAAAVGGIAVIPPGHYCRPTYTGTVVFQTELS